MSFRVTSLLTSALLSGALIISSCGGSAGTIGTNSYPGTWSGSITSTPTIGTPTTGNLSLVISTADAITGTDTITIPGTTTVDTGTISSAGDMTLTTGQSGSSVVIGTITATLTVINNTLVGAGTLTVGSTQTPVSISLALTSTATDRPNLRH